MINNQIFQFLFDNISFNDNKVQKYILYIYNKI